MKSYKKSIAALLFLGLFSQWATGQIVLSSFEDGITTGTKAVDTWEQSPFNTGKCSNTPEVITNPHIDDMNSSEKVLHYIRPYYSGDRNGVEIKLERSFTITPTKQYVHAFVYKPVSSRVLARGLDKANNVLQFESISNTESRANAWSDAVFEVKGNGYEIDRLIIYPDMETAVNRLSTDMDIYIDDIILSSSNVPRSVTDYCRVKGTLTATRYLSLIKTTGASLNINATLNKPESVYTKYSVETIVAEAGSPFTLQFTQKSTSDINNAWIADVYADFNADKEFVSVGEYIGRITGVKSGNDIIYSTEITVPVGTPISSCAVRIKLTDSSDPSIAGAAHSSCSNVADGMAINIPMEISKYAERPIISISGMSEQGGWGAIRFQKIDGTEIKVANGTNVTIIATPNAGYTFKGWYNSATGGIMSEKSTFTFLADYNMSFVAKFSEIEFCTPTGVLPVKYWFGKTKIQPQGQSELYYIGSTTNEVNEISTNVQRISVMGGVNVKRQTTFKITGIKASSSAALSGAKAGVWADWNKDHIFSPDEFIGTYNALNNTQEFSITVPPKAATGDLYVRIIVAETTATAESACNAVSNGVVYDLMVTVTPNDSERFSLSVIPNVPGAATFTLTPAAGSDGKYSAGTNVEITCVPAKGYQFVQWMKDGIPYGATMTSNNPLPLTALNQNLELTMKMSPKFPEYCEGTAPNNGNGNHYGVKSGSVTINSVQAFTFTQGSTAITDLSSSCIAEVCPGDIIKLFVSGSEHSQWAQATA
ncbi:MAG: GEVED domain-containing protein, partial [Bacteroidales bacterium]